MATATTKMRFEVVKGWGKLPKSVKLGQVPHMAVDKQDRVYILNRGTPPLLVFERDGKFVAGLGECILQEPHGVRIDEDGNIWVADRDAHCIVKLSPQGKLLLTIGTRGRPGSVEEGRPFNRPTGVAFASDGSLFISDGYGNARVHHYTSDGAYEFSWGSKGDSPSRFRLPHGIFIDNQNRIYVADRENRRIQCFDDHGTYVKEWGNLERPTDMVVDAEGNLYVPDLGDFVTVLSWNGEVLAKWGGEKSQEPGKFIAPHGIALDSHGDIYVGEVNKGARYQKFARKA
jgi:sugar lactone lactonase YvrE